MLDFAAAVVLCQKAIDLGPGCAIMGSSSFGRSSAWETAVSLLAIKTFGSFMTSLPFLRGTRRIRDFLARLQVEFPRDTSPAGKDSVRGKQSKPVLAMQVVGSRTILDFLVVTTPPVESVPAWSAHEKVVVCLTDERVAAFFSVELIISQAAADQIVSFAAEDKVVACPSPDFVRTSGSEDHVIPVTSGKLIDEDEIDWDDLVEAE